MKIKNPIALKLTPLFIIIFSIQLLVLSCGRHHPRSVYNNSEDEGWIGVYVQDLDDELRRYLDIKERTGVMVNNVIADGPGEKAGLKEEDVIVKFDGRRVRNTRDLTRVVKRAAPRSKVKMEIMRDGGKKTLTLRVGEKERSSYSYRNGSRRRAPRVFSFRGGRRPWFGVQMANLNNDLAGYFGADEQAGVLILSVVKDSPAERAELKAGDIILKIDGDSIVDTDELSSLISDYDSGDEIEIEIKRKGKIKKIKVELEGSSRRSYYDFNREELDDWKQEMQEWKYGLNEWKQDFKNERLYDLESRIRHEIEKSIEIEIPEVEIELNHIGEEIEREMRRLNDELKDLRINIRINEIIL